MKTAQRLKLCSTTPYSSSHHKQFNRYLIRQDRNCETWICWKYSGTAYVVYGLSYLLRHETLLFLFACLSHSCDAVSLRERCWRCWTVNFSIRSIDCLTHLLQVQITVSTKSA